MAINSSVRLTELPSGVRAGAEVDHSARPKSVHRRNILAANRLRELAAKLSRDVHPPKSGRLQIGDVRGQGTLPFDTRIQTSLLRHVIDAAKQRFSHTIPAARVVPQVLGE